MGLEKFEVELKETEMAYVFYLSGELDLSVSTRFRTVLEPVVNRTDKKLTLDLENLKYIDSTGIGIIISVLKLREALQAEFNVQHIPVNIRRLLDITGVSKFLKEGSGGII